MRQLSNRHAHPTAPPINDLGYFPVQIAQAFPKMQ